MNTILICGRVLGSQLSNSTKNNYNYRTEQIRNYTSCSEPVLSAIWFIKTGLDFIIKDLPSVLILIMSDQISNDSL